MMDKILSSGPIAKAIRILLVFSLAFWASFNVECLAFASMYVTAPDEGLDYEGRYLSNLAVWQVDGETGPWINAADPVRDARQTQEGDKQAADLAISADGGVLRLVAVPEWSVDPDWEAPANEPGEEGADTPGGEDGQAGLPEGPEDAEEADGPEVDGGTDGPGGDNVVVDDGEGTSPDASGNDESEGDSSGEDSIASAEGSTSSIDAQAVGGAPSGVGVQDEQDVPVSAARFVSWSVSDDSLVELPIEVSDEGIATIRGKGFKSGEVVVTCTLEGYEGPVESRFADGMAVEFRVDVEAPYVGVLTLHKPASAGGEACGEDLVLTKEESASYALWAEVKMRDAVKNEEMLVEGTESAPLSKASDGRFADLEWSIADAQGNELDPSVASISQEGVLSISEGEGPYVVSCATHDGEGSQPYAVSLRVSVEGDAGQEEDPALRQGEPHPQDSLLVTVEKPVAPAEGSKGADNPDEAQSSGDEGASSAESADDPAGTAEGEREEAPADEPASSGIDTQAVGDDASSDDAPAGDGEGPGSSSASSEGQDGAGEAPDAQEDGIVASKAYTADDLESIGDFGTETYELSIDGAWQRVTGRGVTLAMLLNDVGISLEDQTEIDSIEFVNYRDVHTTIAWSDLVALSHAQRSYIMVAAEAYVHAPDGENGDGEESAIQPQAEADEGEPGTEDGASEPGAVDAEDGSQPDVTSSDDEAPGDDAASSPDSSDFPEAEQQDAASDLPSDGQQEDGRSFYDNTRFQLLYDGSYGSAGDAGELRWLNAVVVHLKGDEPEPQEEVDPELEVYISYVPVPQGETAFLSAVPNQAIGNARFGFRWERSVDGGDTWTELSSDTVQTLRVKTDEEHVGNLYRVTLETDLPREGTDEFRKATSTPVEIVEGSGLVLDYVPPIAGEIAEFVSHWELGASDPVDTLSAEYVWEQSSDGGATWASIVGAPSAATLRIPTNPIDPLASLDAPADEEPTPIVYIRVRALVEGHDPFESNWCPLTVRVGGNDAPTPDESKADEISRVVNDDPVPGDSQEGQTGEDSKPATPKHRKKVVEIATPIVEDEPEPMIDFEEDDLDFEPEPQQSGDMGAVVINEAVSNEIREQEKARADQAKDTTPGLRWTEISAISPNSDELQDIFADNPFAPFALPLGLGITIAGGLEKLLAFRRQL